MKVEVHSQLMSFYINIFIFINLLLVKNDGVYPIGDQI